MAAALGIKPRAILFINPLTSYLVFPQSRLLLCFRFFRPVPKAPASLCAQAFPLCLKESFRVQTRKKITAPTCPNAYRGCQPHFWVTIQASPPFRPRTIYKGRSLPGDAGENGLPAWVVWSLGAQTRGRMTSCFHRQADEAESGPSMWLELPAPSLPEPSTWAQWRYPWK